MRRSQRRTRLSALALNSWLPTASARQHQSTWVRSGPSSPQWNPDPPRITPCGCLPPHLVTVDTIPQLCWTRASSSQRLTPTQTCFLMGITNRYRVFTARGALPTLPSARKLVWDQWMEKKMTGSWRQQRNSYRLLLLHPNYPMGTPARPCWSSPST